MRITGFIEQICHSIFVLCVYCMYTTILNKWILREILDWVTPYIYIVSCLLSLLCSLHGVRWKTFKHWSFKQWTMNEHAALLCEYLGDIYSQQIYRSATWDLNISRTKTKNHIYSQLSLSNICWTFTLMFNTPWLYRFQLLLFRILSHSMAIFETIEKNELFSSLAIVPHHTCNLFSVFFCFRCRFQYAHIIQINARQKSPLVSSLHSDENCMDLLTHIEMFY